MNLFRIALSSFFLLALSWTACAADAPPEVEAALRDRVQQFYQLQKDRKYREADAFIAEDTKEYYFNARKPNLVSFRIVSIDFAPDLQHATVKLMAAAPVPIPGLEQHPLEAPVMSEWKIENGKWFWHFDQSKLLETPFGRVNPTPPSTSLPMAQPPNPVGASIASLRSAVQVEPARVTLRPGKAVTQVVQIKNTLPGPVMIRLQTLPLGLDVSFSVANLAANESAELRITPRIDSKDRPGQLVLRIEPTGQLVTIPILWTTEK